MATYPTGIWVRKPVVDGFTTIDDAMGTLDSARKEVEAIETELGTNVSTADYNTLAERLAVRLSPSGLPRGRVEPMRRWNREVGQPWHHEQIRGWWVRRVRDGGDNEYNCLTDRSDQLSGAVNTITFRNTFTYTVKPDAVLARFAVAFSNRIIGSVTAYDITTTGFTVRAQSYNINRTSWGDPDGEYWVDYMVIGGIR